MKAPMRVNQAYKLDGGPIEAVVLFCRIVRWIVWQLLRFRTEVVDLAVVLVVWLRLRSWLGGPGDYVTLALVLAVLAVPQSRRLVLGRLRCSKTRRALKAMSREEKINNTLGEPPLVIRSRTTQAGERYSLFLRPGQSAEMLQERREGMRAALHCRDVRIDRDPSRSHLVTVHVVRKDVLAVASVTSPLVEYAQATP